MTAEVALPDLGSLSDELIVNGKTVKGRLAVGRVWLTGSGLRHPPHRPARREIILNWG